MIWQKNVLGGILQSCSTDPMTGFFRTGDCQVTEEDVGNHGVCIVATAEFLAFSRSRGNDLSTPQPRVRLSRPEARRSLVFVLGALARSARSGMAPRRWRWNPPRRPRWNSPVWKTYSATPSEPTGRNDEPTR